MAIHKFAMLFKDLETNLGKETALKIFPEYTTIPEKMDKMDKVNLARKIMERMDKTLDRETIVKIRHWRTCNIPKAQRGEMVVLMQKCKDIEEFLIAWFGCIKQEDGTYLTNFGSEAKKCWCNLFHKLDEYEPISITWCECCNGHTQKSIMEICGQPVKTEIMESVASGGKSCRYRITVL
jgi:hypothetical protein